jgi:tRNA modification GTPase
MMLSNVQDTIVALATPQGSGAIGVLRLSGSQAVSIADQLRGRGAFLDQKDSHTLHYCSVRDAKGEVLDEVLMGWMRGPNSYTGEDTVEISCHGSPYVLQNVLQRCLDLGARLAEPGEFTLRAYLNGKMDLSQAEAVADLIASESQAAHRLALHQMKGGFSREIQRLREELIHFTSLLELELDFGEEEVEFADRAEMQALLHKIIQYIQTLTGSFALGNAIKNGVATVIAGRPNAGKSTLLNAFLNYERAIVSDIEGTTRDTIEETINIEGVQFRLIDTAGLRDAQDAIEKIGVQKTLEELERSALVLYVFDAGRISPAALLQDLEELGYKEDKLIVVANKMDTHPYLEAKDYYAEGWMGPSNFVPISAAHQMNIGYLKEVMALKALAQKGQHSVIVSNSRHVEALHKTRKALEQALEGLQQQVTGDFVAMDIRHALYSLAEITGKIDVDRDILGTIFGKFCIGK